MPVETPYPGNKLRFLELAVHQNCISVLVYLGTAQSWLEGGLLRALPPRVEHGVVIAIFIVFGQVVGLERVGELPRPRAP